MATSWASGNLYGVTPRSGHLALSSILFSYNTFCGVHSLPFQPEIDGNPHNSNNSDSTFCKSKIANRDPHSQRLATTESALLHAECVPLLGPPVRHCVLVLHSIGAPEDSLMQFYLEGKKARSSTCRPSGKTGSHAARSRALQGKSSAHAAVVTGLMRRSTSVG